MKLFVTGGSGFIGRNIAEQLASRYEVLAPGRDALELLDEDAVCAFLAKHKPEIIIHCAVRPGHRNAKDPSRQLDHNLRMFFNLMRSPHRFNKMIVLGSGSAYDQRHYLPKMQEDYFNTHVPSDEAGFSKYIISKYAEQAENIIDLRAFGVFGKYEDYAIRFISNLMCKAIFDLPLTMHQNRRLDYIYIDDLIRIIEYFIQKDVKYKTYNVTPDHSIELKTLAEKIKIVSGKNLPIIIRQAGMGVEYSGSNARIRAEIGDLSFTPLDAALHSLYNWYVNHKHLIDKNLLLVDK